MKFKVGDEVRLNIKSKTCLLGFETGNICEIFEIDTRDSMNKSYHIRKYDGSTGWAREDELELAKENIATIAVKFDSDKIVINSDKISIDQNVDALRPCMYVDRPNISIMDRKEENYMKILEIYSRRIIKEIDNELTEKIKEINSEDNVRKILQEAENQLNVLLNRDETNPIILRCDVNCEEKTSRAIVVVQEERDEKERQLNELLMEINAQLEITETYEQKMDILVRYGILNEQWKISDGSEEEPVRKVRKVK